MRVALIMIMSWALAACNQTSSSSQPASLAFSSSTYSVMQSAGTVSVSVTRAGSTGSALSVSYATADGTASAGTDYTAATGTLQWTEGDSTPKTISVPILNAAHFTGDKSFSVALTDPSANASIGNPGTASVMISGDANPMPGTLALSSATYAVTQGSGTLTVTVNRTGGTSGAASVAYATADGTAIAGTDYTASSGTLQWADGDSAPKAFPVTVSNTTPFNGTKTFTVAIASAVGATLGMPVSATATITGDASPSAGNLQMAAASYSVAQSAGSVTLTVNRTGGSSGTVSAAYATANGTAVAGTDYTAANGTLTWANGDATSKTLSVAVSNATPFSGNRSFTVALSNPSAGVTISNPGSSTVAIAGDATPPVGSLEFSAASYSVAQNAGTLTVTVNRVGGTNGAVGVSYATSNGSAVAGTDYTTANGTLQWAAGDASAKTFSVAISNATPFTGNRSFTIALSNPTGGSTLGSPSSVSAAITGGAQAAVGSLQFSASTYTVAQSGGSLTVTVNRTGGSSGAISVAYATTNGTAVAGTDFTAANGTLQWASGDTTSKTFSIAINNATPFTGSKSFTIGLSSPGGGATLSTPTSASATITGSGSTGGGGTGGPSAPTGLLMTAQTQTSISIAWTAATAGANPIASYNIYRNGVKYASGITGTSYTDTAATNAVMNSNESSGPATVYAYAVSAVDTTGVEGAQQTSMTAWLWNGQSYFLMGDYSTIGAIDYSHADTSDAGPYDISVTTTASSGQWWQPYSGVPNTMDGNNNQLVPGVTGAGVSPQWNLEIGAFKYMVVDVYPLQANTTLYYNIVSRGPPGDVFNNAQTVFPANGAFGPYPMVANQWNHYKLPLNNLVGTPSQQLGSCTFTGYISGTTLTVVSGPLSGGAEIQPGGWITGPGVAAATFVNAFNTGTQGGAGTYTLLSSQNVGSASAPVTLTYQRTNYYKMNLVPYPTIGTVYFNKIGFTTD